VSVSGSTLADLREQARRRWGAGYSHARFHEALLRLGSPPLGLMARALEDGDAQGA
jgi:uncharacterized protein (DUF885 family)